MKKRLLEGEMIDLTNKLDYVSIWFQPIGNHFVLELNAKVIKSTKTWNPIKAKLELIGNLKEI